MIAAAVAEHRIASQLLRDGALTPVGLNSMRRESEIEGLPLLEVLLLHDLVSEEDVAKVYAKMTDSRYVDLIRRTPSRAWVLLLPENVARRKDAVLFGEVAGQLIAVVADPVDPSVKAALEAALNRPVEYVVSPRYQIRKSINEIYGAARAEGARPRVTKPVFRRAVPSTTGLNVIEQLDSLMDEAVDRRASDVHIEPEDDRLRVRLRIDGRMVEARAFPIEAAAALISRVKVLATLDITERRRPQDGRFSYRSFDQDVDVRVAVIPTARGERVTMRMLAKDRSLLTLEQLGMGTELRQAFERLITRPHGIILITGPTGSGKTTTLYAALQHINQVDKHIITVEDPVEYHIGGVNQVPVNPEHGVSFVSALRSIVRHDPDVIMVGEIRDRETAHLALEASLTGHLVFATLHTNSAAGAVTRLLDMGSEPYLVASGLIGVMAQRLVRKICVNCRRGYVPNDAERKLLHVPPGRTDVKIYRGHGCSRCLRSGYFDRVGVFEFVPFDSGLSALVMRKATTEEMHAYAVEHGAISLQEDGVTKVRDGLTTLEEVMRVTVATE
jgi:type IV pilus assembly protein PilB